MSWIKEFLEDFDHLGVSIDAVFGLIEVYVTGTLKGKGNEGTSWYVSQEHTNISYSLHGRTAEPTAKLIEKIRIETDSTTTM